MLLESLVRRPLRGLQYLERYVNDGSPSGFTAINRTSQNTDPFGLTPHFNLSIVSGPPSWFTIFGNAPQWTVGAYNPNRRWLLVHPDMVTASALTREHLSISLDESLVVPTSSSRTVQFEPPAQPDYVKLHYANTLGRIKRDMPLRKLLAGLETSDMIRVAIEARGLPSSLLALPETGGTILTIPANDAKIEWGMAWRPFVPIGPGAQHVFHLWPFFSLFSIDRLASYDPPLIAQLLGMLAKPPISFCVDEIVEPIVASYVALITTLGLQPEWNAQNLLLALDKSLRIVGIVMRDMTDVERDISIRTRLGLSVEFESMPYKCISDSDDELYRIRHSFAFDSKLSNYVLDPLARTLAQEYNLSVHEVRGAFRECVSEHIGTLPGDFFPADGCAYEHEKILLTGERPYVTSIPLYR